MGLAGGINPYLYADGNPVNAVDPMGLATLTVHVDTTGMGDSIGSVKNFSHI